MSMFMNKLLGLDYDILPWRKVPESDVLCVVRGLLQRSQLDRQFTVSMFRDCYRAASWTGSLLCPCSGTVTEQPAGQAVYCVYVQGQADYSVFIQCYSQRSQLDRQFTVSISGTVTEQPAGQGYSGSLLIVHVQGQAVYCVHVQGLLQRSQLDRQFTKCPCSGTATAKGSSWTGSLLSVHVQGLLQPKEPAGQFTVSMFRDCYRGASWTGSLLSVHVQGLLQPKEPAGQFTVSMFRDCSRGASWTGSLLSVHVQEQAVCCAAPQQCEAEFRSCVKVEVAVLGFPS